MQKRSCLNRTGFFFGEANKSFEARAAPDSNAIVANEDLTNPRREIASRCEIAFFFWSRSCIFMIKLPQKWLVTQLDGNLVTACLQKAAYFNTQILARPMQIGKSIREGLPAAGVPVFVGICEKHPRPAVWSWVRV